MTTKSKIALCLLLTSLVAKGEGNSLENRVTRLEKLLEQQIVKNEKLEKELAEKNSMLEKTEKVQVTEDNFEKRLTKLEKEADQWELHGYASLQHRSTSDWSSSATTFGKGDFFLGIPGTGESANQVELVAKRKFEGKNGVWGDLNLRAEYGNGDSYYYSSSGAEHDNGKAGFELKEAFINMGGFSYLPENATIWAGKRFLNRNSTSLSGEFYKQSAGVGFGYERNGLSLAVVGVDPGAEDGKQSSEIFNGNGRRTVTAFDVNYTGIKVPGGSLDLGTKYYIQPNAKEPNEKNQTRNEKYAENGFGLGAVYNTNYYGMDGFASHAINFGYGIGAHATGGMNFGQWTDGAVEDAWVMLLTSGGMLNLNEKWQIMTEASLMHGEDLYGLEGSLMRSGLSIQPSYKVNDNFRLVFGATAGLQRLDKYQQWGGDSRTEYKYALSIAPTFTADSDFFGRPQIQPYVTWVHTNFTKGFGGDLEKEESEVIFGVKSEVWF